MSTRVTTPYMTKLLLLEGGHHGDLGFKALLQGFYADIFLYSKYYFNMVMDDEDVLYLLTCVVYRKKLLDSFLTLGLLTPERLYRLCCQNCLPFAEVFLDRPDIVRAIPSQLEDLLATTPSQFCSIILNRIEDINTEDISAVIERGLVRKQYPLGTVKMLTRRGFRFSKALVRQLLDGDHLGSVEFLARNFRIDGLVEEEDIEAQRIIQGLAQCPDLFHKLATPLFPCMFYLTTSHIKGIVEIVDDALVLTTSADANGVYRILHFSLGKLWAEHGGPKTLSSYVGYELAMRLYWRCLRIMYLGLDECLWGRRGHMEQVHHYGVYESGALGSPEEEEFDEVTSYLPELTSCLESFGVSYQTYLASLVSDPFVPVEDNADSLANFKPNYCREYLRRSLCNRSDLPQSWRDVRF
ncbi:hypothetical protein BC832DRAFT_540030 [Gaertneriomyces semiglobifer]|nr:hypothetical protein BC832DRAFT_540030 [Gaertneriomyces semiglobifer]